jgi:hypothetical protein
MHELELESYKTPEADPQSHSKINFAANKREEESLLAI